jgi:hypothetical protein
MFAQRIFPAGIAANWPHKLSINPRLARKFDGEGLVLIDTKGKNFPCYDLVRWITSTQKKSKESVLAGRLGGKSALISGSASGLGEAQAKLFARVGARVVFGARHLHSNDQNR